MNRKVVAYYRYSSNNQDENSIEYQRLAAQEYCKRNNYDLVKEYIDEAKTGTNDNRAGFLQMKKDASKSPTWDAVIFYDFSRFSRDVSLAIQDTAYFHDLDIDLISITQPLDNSNEGYLMRHFIYSLNDYYSKNNAKHTHEGMKLKALQGLHCGGTPPLGYDVDENKKLVINPEEAIVVKLIFDCFDANFSLNQTAELLNSRGYLTKAGKPFTKNSFDNILNQEKYVGIFSWNTTQKRKTNYTRNSHAKKSLEEQVRIENAVPAIIDAEQFYRVQEKRKNHSSYCSPSKSRYHYMLSGLQILKCAECGSFLVGTICATHGRKYTTYSCPNRKSKKCSMKEIHTEILDRAVAFYIASDLRNRKDLKEISELLSVDPICNLLINKKKGIEKSIHNVLHTVSKCYCEETTERLRILNEQKSEVTSQIEACQNYTKELTEENIHKVCNRFAKYLMESKDVEVKKYLRSTVKEILVGNDDVQISLNII